jgi:hypothetical protein
MEKFRPAKAIKQEITQLNPGGDRQDGLHIIREAMGKPFSPENQLSIAGDSIIVDLFKDLKENTAALVDSLEFSSPLILTGSELTFSQKADDIEANPKNKDYYRRAELYSLRAIEYAKNEGGKVLGICFGFQAIANHLFSTYAESCIVPLHQWVVGETVMTVDEGFADGIAAGDYQIRLSLKDALIRKEWSENGQAGIENIDNDEMIVKVLDSGPLVTLPTLGKKVNLIMGYHIKFKESGGEIFALAGHPELPMNILAGVIQQRKDDLRFEMKTNILSLEDDTKKNTRQSIEIVRQFLSSNDSQNITPQPDSQGN